MTSPLGDGPPGTGTAKAWAWLAAVCVLLAYVPVWWKPELLPLLTREDGLYENLGAGAWFAAALLFVIAARKKPPRLHCTLAARRLNGLDLALGFLLLLGGLEEINWGQRLLGYRTPAWLAELNVRGETNVHNLAPLLAAGPGAARHFTVANLVTVSWLGFCVLVPLLARLAPRLRRWLAERDFPLVPLGLSWVFVANQVLYSTLVRRVAAPWAHGVIEIEETNLALLFSTAAAAELARRACGGPTA